MEAKLQTITLTVTGLRSHKLFGKDYNDPKYIRLVRLGLDFLQLSPWITQVNLGMATGMDLLFGLSAVNHKKNRPEFKIKCFVPGKNQTKYYSEKEIEIYNFILEHADEVIMTSKGNCTSANLKRRNKKMVKECDWVLGFWNFSTNSGTWHTIKHAIEKDKTVYLINPFNKDNRGFTHISNEFADSDLLTMAQYNYQSIV